MTQVRWFRAFGMFAISLMLSLVLVAQSGDPAVIQQKLNEQFKLTTTTADRTDIVTAGDIVTLHKPGLVMFSADTLLPPTNNYKNHQIIQGFGTQMQMLNKDIAQRKFVPGEKFWVTRIMVQNDCVSLDLYSDPYSDIRYYSTLKILFPDKKIVPPVDTIMSMVAEVVTAAPSGDQGGAQQAPAPAPAPVQAPVAIQAIVPPAPPSDAPPPTIALGQSKDEVTVGFGQPARVAKLGVKDIYYYKDMKVTFTNGKVSNVE